VSGESNFEVLFERRGAAGLITLNRPAALNALTESMCVAMDDQLQRWQDDPAVATVVIRGAGERAFCAGGDIRALYEAGRAGAARATDFYRREYRLNTRIKHFPKPYVALLHGVVMGGGVGVSVHGSHRVADTTAVFAMPETGIGLFPDVGGSYFLPRLPGETGMYLALTGARLKSADMAYTGIATHGIAASAWNSLIERLADGMPVDRALADGTTSSGVAPLAERRAIIDRCFAERSVEEVLAALDRERDDWAASVASSIRTKSPTSLKISLRELREGRQRAFDDCMRMEFRMVSRVMEGSDFFEGVRATIIEKDKTPAWRPATLAAVSNDDVNAYFAPLGENELRLGL
jgi:enoyl-CoA hydratase